MTDLVAVSSNVPSAFSGGMAGVSAKDIVLPMLTIRQNAFRKDTMKKFKPGDIILRPDDIAIGGPEKNVFFVPISCEKCYRITDISDLKNVRTVGYESAAKELDYEFVTGSGRDTKTFRRDRCFMAHVLLRERLTGQADIARKLAAGEFVDPDDFSLPTRLVFTRGALQAGKVLFTHHEMSKALNNQSPAFITYILKTVEMRNDMGSWFAFSVEKAPKDLKYTPTELLPACDFWVKTMAHSQFKSHEDEDESVAEVVSAAAIDEKDARF